VVYVVAGGEVVREPHPRPCGNAQITRHRKEEHGKVPAASHETPFGRTLFDQVAVVQLDFAGQHGLSVAGVDLRQPLPGDLVVEKVTQAVVDDEAPHDPAKAGDVPG
jgi:hypothetical protein